MRLRALLPRFFWLYPRLPITISASKYMIFLPNKCRSGVIEGVPYAVFPVVHRPRPADGAPHCMPGAPSGRASAVSACGPTGETCFDRTLRNRRDTYGPEIPKIHAISSLGDPDIAFFLQMIEERTEEGCIQVRHGYLRRRSTEALLYVLQQKAKSIAITGNGVRADLSLLHQSIHEEGLQQNGEGFGGIHDRALRSDRSTRFSA